jgi:hypothetical protein
LEGKAGCGYRSGTTACWCIAAALLLLLLLRQLADALFVHV